jgi:hypothetical protein
MNNQSLNFFHEIPIEVYHENTDVSIKVSINDLVMFEKVYSPGVVHTETIRFHNEYIESNKNTICFDFSGDAEAQHKYLKINSILINNIWLNLFNADYRPILNQEWWDSLPEEEQESYLDIIYGINGNTFGWFGKIIFKFAAGYDWKSKFNKESHMATILNSKENWIFLDETDNQPWEKR